MKQFSIKISQRIEEAKKELLACLVKNQDESPGKYPKLQTISFTLIVENKELYQVFTTSEETVVEEQEIKDDKDVDKLIAANNPQASNKKSKYKLITCACAVLIFIAAAATLFVIGKEKNIVGLCYAAVLPITLTCIAVCFAGYYGWRNTQHTDSIEKTNAVPSTLDGANSEPVTPPLNKQDLP